VIVDLVVNHTSDQHPWFRQARSDPASKYRDYYIWSKEKPPDADQGVVFPGAQHTIWSWDEAAGAYYHHRFWPFQPDLNIANPAVRKEILKIMGFWLELGVSGFRVDAVPFLLDEQSQSGKGEKEDWEFLTTMRDFLSWRSGDAILLAEANVTMDEVNQFFDDGQRMQLVFNFIANQQLYLSLVSHDATPLADALRSAPQLADAAQWASFLRNHDELDLGRLSDAERKRVFDELGPDPNMQLYGRGLRRRLAPMLKGDIRVLSFAYSLMLSLPGTPVFWYGEEIGMGENLELEDRHSVRTPMQWSTDGIAGFTRASHVVRAPVSDGPYTPRRVNVAAQRRDPESLLNRIERLIRTRKECPEIGWGECRVLDTSEPSVLALRYDYKDSSLLIVHNFAESARRIHVALDARDPEGLVDVLSGEHAEAASGREHDIALEGYGFRWFRIGAHDSALGPKAREPERRRSNRSAK
jgi:maltose alpha-D-glucosyltransferase/alpha-amylase